MQQRMWWGGVGLLIGLIVLMIGLAEGGTAPVAAQQPAQRGRVVAPTPGVCNPDWSIVASPNVGSGDNVLEGLAPITANDVWAVGWYDTGNYTPRTLTQHWDGTAWSIVPSPSVGAPEEVFQAVAAVASNDVWAVGYASLDPLIEHWNGSAWLISPAPRIGTYTNELKGVAALAADDVWAVGEYYAGPNPTDRRPFSLHWDGSTWTIVATPAIPAYLWGVTAISSNDVWAVGFDNTGAVALHWDGSAWNVVAVPAAPAPASYVLYGVSAAGPNDVWAVGIISDPNANPLTLTMHWNGTAWSVVSSPSPAAYNYLYAVAAVGAGDAWAVGDTSTGTQNATLTLHWDGAAWTQVPSPNPVGGPFLDAVAALGPTDVWAAGAYFDTGAARQTLTEHYTSPCPSPTPGATGTPTSTPNPLTPSATPTRPTMRSDAHLCLSLREDPDGAVPPGGLVTYTLTLVNQGPGEADTSSVHLPLDPNLEVLDAHTSNPRIYVDYVGDDAVAVRFQDLGVGKGGTAQIIARVRPESPPGALITSRAAAVWTDLHQQHRQSNSVTLRVGPPEDRGLHGLQQALVVEPGAPVAAGTQLALHGDFFAEDEPVSAWLNAPDATVQPVTERARSEGSGLVRLSLDTADLAAGTYTLVAHGWCSGVEGVGVFTVR